MLSGEGNRPGRHQLLQLQEGDDRSGERHTSHKHREGHSDEESAGVGVLELEQCHDGCRTTTDTVKQRDELWHLSHLHGVRRQHRHNRPDHDHTQNPGDVVEFIGEEHGGDTNDGSECSQKVASTGGLR